MTETYNPTSDAPQRAPLAKCEKHGLHYDPTKMTGCVLCRRESSPAADAPPVPRRSLLGPFLVTAALCFGAGLAFYLLHGAVANLFPGSASTPEVPQLTAPQQQQLDQALRELTGGNPTGMTSGIEGGLPTQGTPPE
ncbi:MAG TPA: hypothetical protein VN851_03065 [Thermoanaerobaculia bacterium]|nr:hypothetical protein [Thermoanaerobaculia bacterium]